MKSNQKIILIKVLIILSIAFVILNVSQLHLNNNNKINLKRRDTKFFIQQDKVVSFNKNNENEINNSIQSISINENDKNNIIHQLNSDSSIEIKSSEDLIIIQESLESSAPIQTQDQVINEEVVVPSTYDNMNLDVDINIKFVPGEAPKFSNRNLDC